MDAGWGLIGRLWLCWGSEHAREVFHFFRVVGFGGLQCLKSLRRGTISWVHIFWSGQSLQRQKWTESIHYNVQKYYSGLYMSNYLWVIIMVQILHAGSTQRIWIPISWGQIHTLLFFIWTVWSMINVTELIILISINLNKFS
jgi:hypothetical protein